MNFFGYISINAIIVQVIWGMILGGFLGLFIPSEYEKNQSLDSKQKVWHWKKYKPNFSLSDIFLIPVKALIILSILSYINVLIARALGVSPMSKYSPHLHIFTITFFIMIISSKYSRYLYFRYKLDKILENEIL